jgi:hypothetical protein
VSYTNSYTYATVAEQETLRMRRKITGETWEQMKTGYAAGIGRRESPACSCVSITL